MSFIKEQRRDGVGDDDDDDQFNLREWSVKARLVSRENTSSRRFSASNLRSFREDTKSFRSNFTISSTASSPGYTLREEIDPTTYSFTTALRALQARSVYSWEIASSPEGFALNSKWSDAEKYICNPLSGEVPIECLSAKTLSGRYIPSLAGRITMSAPLIYPSSYSRPPPHHHAKSSLSPIDDFHQEAQFPIQEKKVGSQTRDVGTQSIAPEVSSSSSLSPAPTPSIGERSIVRFEIEVEEDSPTYDVAKPNFEEKVLSMHVEVRERRDDEEEEITKRKDPDHHHHHHHHHDQKKNTRKQMWRCRQARGCLSWKSLWIIIIRKRQRSDQKQPSLFSQH